MATPIHSYYDRLVGFEVFTRLFHVYLTKPSVFLTLSVLFLVPVIVVMAVLAGLLNETMKDLTTAESNVDPQNPDTLSAILEAAPKLTGMIAFQSLLYVVATVAGRGAMVRAVAEIYVGVEPDWFECVKVGASRFWALFCSGFIVFGAVLAIQFLPVLFLVPAMAFNSVVLYLLTVLVGLVVVVAILYFSLCTILIFPAIVIENLSAWGGVKRSFELTRNRWCFVFGIYATYMVVVGIGASIFQKIILGTDPMAPFTSVLGVVVTFLPEIILLPAVVILQVVLYFNLRIDKEGMNLATLQRDVLSNDDIYNSVELDDNDTHSAKLIRMV